MPSILQAATGNTFPGGTAYVFQYDVNNPRPDRRDDLVKIWFPNEAAPFIDAAARTVNVAGVYASATPRYVVEYGQDPTDADMYGRVVRETVGDPANGVGGTYQYLYTTQDLPGIPIPSRSGRPDRLPLRAHRPQRQPDGLRLQRRADAGAGGGHAEPGEDRHPLDGHLPSYVTWTAYNSHNQPLLQILPEGNSLAYTYEDGIRSRAVGPALQPPRGLLLSRTALSGQFGRDRAGSRSGSSGQSQLTETFFYEPIFNQLCARIERRGNPIDGSGGYFPPQNGGTRPATAAATPRSPITITRRTTRRTVSGDTVLQSLAGPRRRADRRRFKFVNTQMSNAGRAVPDRLPQPAWATSTATARATGPVPACTPPRTWATWCKVQHPTVNLINPDPNTGLSTQPRIEVFTSNARGQTTTHTDPNGNLTVFVRYPYNDPEGNGGMAGRVPAALGGKQYGRLKEIHVDADPNDVLSLVGGDGDLVDFIPATPAQLSATTTPKRLPGPGDPLRGRQRGRRQRLRVVRLRPDGQSPGRDRPPRLHHPLRPQRTGRGLSHHQPAALQFPRGDLFRRQPQRGPGRYRGPAAGLRFRRPHQRRFRPVHPLGQRQHGPRADAARPRRQRPAGLVHQPLHASISWTTRSRTTSTPPAPRRPTW